jgi:DNA-3-methyladenine glycosylase
MAEHLKSLPRSFYLRPTLQVAQDLLGKYIVRSTKNTLLTSKIVEVEAYCKNDPASHAFRGRTKRNDVMFWEGGHLYVYFTYGMHFCANIVTNRENIGEAVLIRAVEPIAGIEAMIKNRFPQLQFLNRRALIQLTNGPAKFCQAFGITRSENGIDLLDSEFSILDREPIPPTLIKRSTRIGIQKGKEKKWRFFLSDNLWISK